MEQQEQQDQVAVDTQPLLQHPMEETAAATAQVSAAEPAAAPAPAKEDHNGLSHEPADSGQTQVLNEAEAAPLSEAESGRSSVFGGGDKVSSGSAEAYSDGEAAQHMEQQQSAALEVHQQSTALEVHQQSAALEVHHTVPPSQSQQQLQDTAAPVGLSSADADAAASTPTFTPSVTDPSIANSKAKTQIAEVHSQTMALCHEGMPSATCDSTGEHQEDLQTAKASSPSSDSSPLDASAAQMEAQLEAMKYSAIQLPQSDRPLEPSARVEAPKGISLPQDTSPPEGTSPPQGTAPHIAAIGSDTSPSVPLEAVGEQAEEVPSPPPSPPLAPPHATLPNEQLAVSLPPAPSSESQAEALSPPADLDVQLADTYVQSQDTSPHIADATPQANQVAAVVGPGTDVQKSAATDPTALQSSHSSSDVNDVSALAKLGVPAGTAGGSSVSGDVSTPILQEDAHLHVSSSSNNDESSFFDATQTADAENSPQQPVIYSSSDSPSADVDVVPNSDSKAIQRQQEALSHSHTDSIHNDNIHNDARSDGSAEFGGFGDTGPVATVPTRAPAAPPHSMSCDQTSAGDGGPATFTEANAVTVPLQGSIGSENDMGDLGGPEPDEAGTMRAPSENLTNSNLSKQMTGDAGDMSGAFQSVNPAAAAVGAPQADGSSSSDDFGDIDAAQPPELAATHAQPEDCDESKQTAKPAAFSEQQTNGSSSSDDFGDFDVALPPQPAATRAQPEDYDENGNDFGDFDTAQPFGGGAVDSAPSVAAAKQVQPEGYDESDDDFGDFETAQPFESGAVDSAPSVATSAPPTTATTTAAAAGHAPAGGPVSSDKQTSILDLQGDAFETAVADMLASALFPGYSQRPQVQHAPLPQLDELADRCEASSPPPHTRALTPFSSHSSQVGSPPFPCAARGCFPMYQPVTSHVQHILPSECKIPEIGGTSDCDPPLPPSPLHTHAHHAHPEKPGVPTYVTEVRSGIMVALDTDTEALRSCIHTKPVCHSET